jgi:hypothetical protein
MAPGTYGRIYIYMDINLVCYNIVGCMHFMLLEVLNG